MTITMPPPPSNLDTAAIAKMMLGHSCYYGWPHHTLQEGLVVGISDGQRQFDAARTVKVCCSCLLFASILLLLIYSFVCNSRRAL